jgi:hypothetical protein
MMRCYVGLNKLNTAISIGKYIVSNEAKGPVQDSFVQKIKELMVRQTERTKQLKEGKPIQCIKRSYSDTNTNGGGGGKSNGKDNNEDDKLRGAMSEAIVT